MKKENLRKGVVLQAAENDTEHKKYISAILNTGPANYSQDLFAAIE
jgi:hypothetical protein